MPTPFLVTEDKVMTIQSADTTDEAGKKAVLLMEEYIRETAGIDEVKAGMLMSLAADMCICPNCRSPDDSARGISPGKYWRDTGGNPCKIVLGKGARQ